MIKILHTGDWHIGYFPGPTKEGTNQRFLDKIKVLEKLVKEAKQEKPDAIVIAGDLVHLAKTWADRGITEVKVIYNILKELKKIAPVIVLRGTPNHDGEAQFELLKTMFGKNKDIFIATTPQTFSLTTASGEKVNFVCVPGFDRGYFRAKSKENFSREKENEFFTNSIADIILGEKSKLDKNETNVLVSHYMIPGANMESGQTAFDAKNEPIISVKTLLTADFDLVCMGHIHRPQQIKGCKNTFYCGGIAEDNFNDENQNRGYYIHDIDKNKNVVTSEFKEINSRKHLTIYLDNDDIEAFNKNTISDSFEKQLDLVKNKMVRVFFSCTENQKKALNSALLEQTLFDHGAFWVYGISPQKINKTVDKETIKKEGSPLENLTNYLEKKKYSKEKIAKLLKLATSIIETIDDIIAYGTGTIKLENLKWKNYRNYKETGELDFSNIHFCSINGKNGVGKSSLLEMIIDCLFEKTREKDVTGWINNDSEEGSLQLIFTVDKKKYKVVRTRSKKGKPTLNVAEYVGKEWQNRSCEKTKDTQKEIEKIFGMNIETLKACSLIMQDQYDYFLAANKETKMQILSTLLGLGIYDEMLKKVIEKMSEISKTNDDLKTKEATLTEQLIDEKKLVEIKKQLTSKKDSLEKELADLNKTVEKTEASINELKQSKSKREEKLSSKEKERKTKEETKKNKQAEKEKKEEAKAKEKKTREDISQKIKNAEILLENEPKIKKNIEVLESLRKQRNDLTASSKKYENCCNEIENKKNDLNSITNNIKKSKSIIAKNSNDIKKIDQFLKKEKDIEKTYSEYVILEKEVQNLDKKLTDYLVISKNLKDAENTVNTQKNKVEKSKERVQNLEKRIALLEESKCPFPNEATGCIFLKDAIEAKNKLPEAKNNLAKENKALNRLTGKLETIKNDFNALSDLPTELEKKRKQRDKRKPAEKLHFQLDQEKKAKSILEETLNNEQRNLEAFVKQQKDVENQLAEEKETQKVLQKDMDRFNSLEEKILKMEKWEKYAKNIPIARERRSNNLEYIKKLDENIKNLGNDINNIDNDINNIDEEIVQLNEVIKKLKTELSSEYPEKINSFEVELKELKEQRLKTDENYQNTLREIGGIEENEKQNEKLKTEIEKARTQIIELSEYIEEYEILKNAFSKEGIPHDIIRSIKPEIEMVATRILSSMAGSQSSEVEFLLEKQLKSKKEVPTLEVVINDNVTGRLPYLSRSGGEKVKASLSIILALAEVRNRMTGVKPGFLFIDEPPFLDDDGVQAYCDALETIRREYPDLSIMAITHDMSLQDRFPESITVVKENGRSTLIA